MKKSLLVISPILILAFAAPAFSAYITRTYNFSAPVIESTTSGAVVTVAECWTIGLPGNPELPAFGGKLLLPPGNSAISASATYNNPVSLGVGYYILPAQQQHPLSISGPFTVTPANPQIYASNSTFPTNLVDNITTQFGRGYSIAYFQLHPVVYNPVSGELTFYSSITVTFQTSSTPEAQQALNFLRSKQSDVQEISAQIDNPEYISVYPSSRDETDDEFVDYLIITDEELYDSFLSLSDYKNASGVSTEIVLKSFIESTYPGFDTPAKIRACIADYYITCGTDYVLLAGDNENVPKRALYAAMGGEIDPDIAADLYFGCLDGNFNADGDQYMGEPNDNPDLTAEVHVGRAAVDSPSEAANFIAKQIAYQHSPVADEITMGLMLGEDLEWAVYGSAYKEEIRLGSSMWGYTTTGFPTFFEVDTLYDYPGYHYSAIGDVLPLLNEGPQLVNHLGHANNTYTLKFGGNDINDNNMTNNGVNHNFNIIYSQGCYCNSWDNRTPDFGFTGSDAISEKWTSIQNGAVCFIGNTRYGWGSYSNTNGASQYGDRQFFDAIFGENITQIGRALSDSKEDCIPFLGNVSYYCYYECGLLGDPTLRIWTNTPQSFQIAADTSISIGDTTFILEVENASGALCAISQNGQLLGSTNSGSLGTVTIHLSQPIQTIEPVRLMVTKENYLPYDLTLDVYVPNAPNVLFNGITVDDSQFNNDNMLNLGEIPRLDLTLINFSGVNASGVIANLNTDSQYITITDGTETIGSLTPNQTLSVSGAFEIQVSPQVPDEYTAEFEIDITDGVSNQWTYTFSLPVSAPIVSLSSVTIDDGNDMRLIPGETASIDAVITNTGSGGAYSISAVIHSDSPYINIIENTGSLQSLEPNSTGSLTPVFLVQASPNCPLSANIPIYLDINDSRGYYRSTLFEIIVGGMLESFETGAGEWTSTAITPGFTDQWGLSSNRNFTLNGSSSFHCGPANGSDYANNLDAGLLSPEYEILPGATLTFRHWMEAEVSQSNPGECYDGGIVELSLAGGPFMQLYPVGGYNSLIREYPPNMGPFLPHLQVFSGNIFWEEEVFDLDVFPDFTGVFRFRFGSNGSGTAEGWYIDDVEVSYYSPVSPPVNFTGELIEPSTVHLEWNSPGTPVLQAGKSGNRSTDALICYKVYRNNILIADNVQALFYNDNIEQLPAGTYNYTATAFFNKGESVQTSPVTIEYVTSVPNSGENAVPVEYYVKSNYPNPFNASTMISFGLPEASNVKISVHNILGRQIAVLKNENMQAGSYSVIWNAENTPSGLYFYCMTSGKFKSTGKMLLIK